MRPGRKGRHVPSRWGRWLRSIFADAARVRGLPNERQSALTLADELAALIAVDPEDRTSHPRSAVRAWLEGASYISPARVFKVGQRLGDVRGVRPVPGAALSLLAAGHFESSIALTYEFFLDAVLAASPA